MIKTVTVLHRRSDLTEEAFHRHWRERHAPLVRALPGVRRYVQSRPVEAGPQFSGKCSGIAEVWYDDMEALRVALDSPEYERLIADEPTFLGRLTAASFFVAVVEDEVL